MQKFVVDGITVEVYNKELNADEIRAYIDRARLAKPQAKLIKIQIVVDGDEADITSEYEAVPFERIRRITGYLVGRLNRTSPGKEAEIKERTPNIIDRDLADVLAEVEAR